MAWMMPAPPPALADLFKRGGQLPPNPFGATSGAAQPVQTPPMTASDPLRQAVAPQAAPTPAPAPPPAPSDDPAISPVPAPPDLSNNAVTDLQKQMSGTSAQIAAVPRPDPVKFKPSGWRRLAGGLVAGAAAYGHVLGAMEIGQNVVNAPWNQAQTNYKRTVSPLQSQLENERQQVPMAEAAAKIPQTNWENRMRQHTAEREDFTAQGNLGYKQDLNNIRTMLDNNKHDEALKKIDETAEKNKNDLDVKNQLLDLKNQALDLKRQQIENGAGKKGQLTDNQKASIENRKAQSLQRAEQNYRRSVGQLSPTDEQGKKDAQDQLEQDKQAAQDNYENEISSAGGSPSHMDVNAPKSAPQNTPAAQPQAANAGKSLVGARFDPHDLSAWKGRETKRIALEDGSKWELQNGKPVQVQAPTKK